MKELAILEYTFMFEPGIDTWSRGGEFEDDLSDFLASHGLEANVVKTVGGTGRRVIYIERVDKLNKLRNNVDQPQKGLQKALKDVMKKASEASGQKGKK